LTLLTEKTNQVLPTFMFAMFTFQSGRASLETGWKQGYIGTKIIV